jgi:hypothetical protein
MRLSLQTGTMTSIFTLVDAIAIHLSPVCHPLSPTSGKLRKREKPEQHEFGSATPPSLTGPVQSRSNAINLTTIVHTLADSLPLKNSAQ